MRPAPAALTAMMNEVAGGFAPFSKKQLAVLTWWCKNSPRRHCDAIICDGAVRSGKTVSMGISFVAWAFYRFSGQSFAVCGKTVTSLRRNIVAPLLPVLQSLGFSCRYKISGSVVEISRGGRVNRFYLFGGRDESSAALIQGMTLAGVMLDEAALMPRSFVEQALARCSVSGSKFWFNCNPGHPSHWFYNEWVKKSREKNAFYLHFTMDDNPSLTPTIRERYRSLYSGAFYERFVLGKWTAAEGLVYPMFDEHAHVCGSPAAIPGPYYISCDYGTVNPSSFGLWAQAGGAYYRIAEYYHDSRKTGAQRTDEEHYSALCVLAGANRIEAVVVDPSAASFMECVRRHGRFRVMPAKNEVLDGIRKVSDALKSGKIMICRGCRDIIREFSLYQWDEMAAGDAPKKQNDHAMDDMRYFVSTILYGNRDDGFFGIAVDRTSG